MALYIVASELPDGTWRRYSQPVRVTERNGRLIDDDGHEQAHRVNRYEWAIAFPPGYKHPRVLIVSRKR